VISFIIPFRSDGTKERERSFKYVHDALVSDWPDDEVIVVDSGDQIFNRSASRNEGAAQASGDVLVFQDADSWVLERQIKVVLSHVTSCKTWGLPWGLPYDTYFSLSERGTEEFYEGFKSPHFDYVFPGPDPIDRPASVGGCVVVHRTAFETVHGYDEEFQGWGYEDRAFALSLETLCHGLVRAYGNLYHLWHPEPEEQRFGQAWIEGNRAVYNAYVKASGNPEEMRALVEQH